MKKRNKGYWLLVCWVACVIMLLASGQAIMAQEDSETPSVVEASKSTVMVVVHLQHPNGQVLEQNAIEINEQVPVSIEQVTREYITEHVFHPRSIVDIERIESENWLKTDGTAVWTLTVVVQTPDDLLHAIQDLAQTSQAKLDEGGWEASLEVAVAQGVAAAQDKIQQIVAGYYLRKEALTPTYFALKHAIDALEQKGKWLLIEGQWFFEVKGVRQTGWLLWNGVWYYLRENGQMATGWLQLNGTWYYLRENGQMATGWLQLNGSWYYLHEGGPMAKGWLQLNGTWYYLHEGGQMATGWLQLNGTWYYLHEGGQMAKGWLQLNGTWYYLAESGAMLVGTHRLGSKVYHFDQTGRWLP